MLPPSARNWQLIYLNFLLFFLRLAASEIRQSRHAIDCIPIVASRYFVYEDPNRPKTPPPPK
jgi:hypothetical protein